MLSNSKHFLPEFNSSLDLLQTEGQRRQTGIAKGKADRTETQQKGRACFGFLREQWKYCTVSLYSQLLHFH